MNTTWAAVVSTLPEAATPERDALLLEQVRAGNIQHNWATITAESSAHTIELEVSEDALRVGTPVDAVRITVNASTAQRIADHVDAMLLTPRASCAGRARLRLRESGDDERHRVSELVLHHSRLQPDDPIPEVGEIAVTPHVRPPTGRGGVHPAVDLNHELARCGHEVCDVPTNGDLAPKPHPELGAREGLPQNGFGERGRRAMSRSVMRTVVG